MDSLYGNLDDSGQFHGEPGGGIETPTGIGNDERRMHVRAYNYWVSMLGDRTFPSIEDLEPENLSDFGPNSVLLDFTTNIEDPTIQFLGHALRRECGIDETIESTMQVPSRSLLSRLTDHYLQIIANRAPVGFEAEFVNHRGNNTMYRGILMPFSSDDDTIDFIYGVINWKEVAEPALVTQISEEIAQSYRHVPELFNHGWADGPSGQQHAPALSGSLVARELVMPLVGVDDDADDDVLELDLPVIDGDAGLGDHLAAARACAETARAADGRSRAALYRALDHAWDFAVFARSCPDDFADILDESGIKVQQRAPMTAIIKLVFGIDHDKSRITEYAAVLDHAARLDIGSGGLLVYLDSIDGGLKAVVKAEREARRGESAAAAKPKVRRTAQSTLSSHAPVALLDLDPGDCEFVVMIGCRTDDGQIAILTPVSADDGMVDRVMREIDRNKQAV